MNSLRATRATHDVAVDAALVTSECQSIAEIAANSVTSEADDRDDANKHESHDSGELVQLADPSFEDAVVTLDLLCRYVAPQSDSNAAF
ncbi:hypothetical protein HPB50_025603 [Hyalomma asiaticum]|uniref:Uncharacterized protein n=1 Tax=Hyalomma asiaticum TaxID=266040 RepID=A0ACB7T938_HYAAI|nr:hypothetical protein HPB50_025603 [Hyalomma asiaticum]